MSRNSLFFRPSFKYGLSVGTCTLIAGSACSFILASYILSSCQKVVDHAISNVNHKIKDFEILLNITFNHTHYKIPAETILFSAQTLLETLEYAKSQEKTFCYNIPFAFLLLMTGLSALACASAAITITNQSNKNEEENSEGYQRINP